jgi:hypothetical protein
LQNYRSGFLRNAHRWNFDHDWFLVVGCFHTGRDWLCRAGNGKGSSAILGIGICQRTHAATDSAIAPKHIKSQAFYKNILAHASSVNRLLES